MAARSEEVGVGGNKEFDPRASGSSHLVAFVLLLGPTASLEEVMYAFIVVLVVHEPVRSLGGAEQVKLERFVVPEHAFQSSGLIDDLGFIDSGCSMHEDNIVVAFEDILDFLVFISSFLSSLTTLTIICWVFAMTLV